MTCFLLFSFRQMIQQSWKRMDNIRYVQRHQRNGQSKRTTNHKVVVAAEEQVHFCLARYGQRIQTIVSSNRSGCHWSWYCVWLGAIDFAIYSLQGMDIVALGIPCGPNRKHHAIGKEYWKKWWIHSGRQLHRSKHEHIILCKDATSHHGHCADSPSSEECEVWSRSISYYSLGRIVLQSARCHHRRGEGLDNGENVDASTEKWPSAWQEKAVIHNFPAQCLKWTRSVCQHS